MDLCFKNRLAAGATTISNSFIDHYMAGASGEYVKVYLYLLRHQEEIVTVEAVADALDHTEADVRRALAYWQRAGVLGQAEAEAGGEVRKAECAGAGTGDRKAECAGAGIGDRKAEYAEDRAAGHAAAGNPAAGDAVYGAGRTPGDGLSDYREGRGTPEEGLSGYREGLGTSEAGSLASLPRMGYTMTQPSDTPSEPQPGRGSEAGGASGNLPTALTPEHREEAERPASGAERGMAAGAGYAAAARETAVSCDMAKLADDEAFKQLAYIAEKYLNKVLTQTDCQILGNLYGNLRMAPELLEYLIEYCVQNHHTSLRYIEKVALSWHERRIRTVEEARAYARLFSKDFFAVMKAMGLNGRNPADSEIQMMEKWFREYGFTKEIIVEACTRTIQAIHKPSFQYADRILSDWKKADVRAFRDVAALDKQRRDKAEGEKKEESAGGSRGYGQSRGSGQGREQNPGQNRRSRTNRFHNLEEHGYDYDEMVWNMINSGTDTGGEDGTQ